jgi:hypothetical protein
MLAAHVRLLLTLAIPFVLCTGAGAQIRGDLVFSSKDFGFPEIDTTITFTPDSERTFRIEYSKPPPHPDMLMLYTYLYFCTARKVAIERGFDRFGILPEEGQTLTATAFFLRPGEEANQVLGPRFAKTSALPVTYPTIAAMCDAKPSQPKP